MLCVVVRSGSWLSMSGLSCVCCPGPVLWPLMEGFQSQWGWVCSRRNCWNCCLGGTDLLGST